MLEVILLHNSMFSHTFVLATKSSTLRFINLNLLGVDWSCAELGTLLKEAKKKKELYIKSDYLTDS